MHCFQKRNLPPFLLNFFFFLLNCCKNELSGSIKASFGHDSYKHATYSDLRVLLLNHFDLLSCLFLVFTMGIWVWPLLWLALEWNAYKPFIALGLSRQSPTCKPLESRTIQMKWFCGFPVWLPWCDQCGSEEIRRRSRVGKLHLVFSSFN